MDDVEAILAASSDEEDVHLDLDNVNLEDILNEGTDDEEEDGTLAAYGIGTDYVSHGGVGLDGGMGMGMGMDVGEGRSAKDADMLNALLQGDDSSSGEEEGQTHAASAAIRNTSAGGGRPGVGAHGAGGGGGGGAGGASSGGQGHGHEATGLFKLDSATSTLYTKGEGKMRKR